MACIKFFCGGNSLLGCQCHHPKSWCSLRVSVALWQLLQWAKPQLCFLWTARKSAALLASPLLSGREIRGLWDAWIQMTAHITHRVSKCSAVKTFLFEIGTFFMVDLPFIGATQPKRMQARFFYHCKCSYNATNVTCFQGLSLLCTGRKPQNVCGHRKINLCMVAKNLDGACHTPFLVYGICLVFSCSSATVIDIITLRDNVPSKV